MAKIAVEQSQTSIRCIEDVWSSEKIQLDIDPQPRTIVRSVLEEIIIRSFAEYLRRPGHVFLPGGMISDAEFEKERGNSLLRVRKLWEYWHGSPTLNAERTRVVSAVLTFFITS